MGTVRADMQRMMSGARVSILPVLIVLAFLYVPAAEAQRNSLLDDPIFQREAERGLNLLYNMKFREASVIFDRIDRRYPNHPAGPFFKALNTWWVILLDLYDESHDDEFLVAMDEVIRRSDLMLRQSRSDLDAMFFKGAALGFRGRLRANRGHWLRAANDGRRAMSYVLGVADADPDNPDFYFGRGIYNYYADVLPQRYSFARPFMIFFPRGDREQGLRELEHVFRRGRFIQTESAYYLLQIYHVIENDAEQSRRYASWLRRRHPDNAFFHAFEGRVHARWGDWNQSAEIFSEILRRHDQGQTGYNHAAAEQALYYLGRHRMLYSDYEQALRHLERLERISRQAGRDSFFAVLGRLRQGMAYDASGRREEAVRCYREVLSMQDWQGSRDAARRYLRQPFGASHTN